MAMAKANFNVLPEKGKCFCCLEGDLEIVSLDGDRVCCVCVQKLFTFALGDEGSYPAKWNDKILHPRCFIFVPPAFTLDYEQKEREYRCPVPNPIFCANTVKSTATSADALLKEHCNTFLGEKFSTAPGRCDVPSTRNVRCVACKHSTCLLCGDPIQDSAANHRCKRITALDAVAAAFEGQIKGKDFQICPSKRCGRRIALLDGCNHMTCICDTHFCFICGAFASEGSGHWALKADGTLPACPKYNQPGAENMMFDAPTNQVTPEDAEAAIAAWDPRTWDELARDVQRAPEPAQQVGLQRQELPNGDFMVGGWWGSN